MTAKILILDDESSACQVIDNFLVAEGYALRFAANGVEGLDQARAWQPDVILCDVMMPVMDGFEFCRQIRADATLEQVPIILVTALNDQQAKLSGLQAGADDFISKPVDAYELRARLRTLTRLDRFRKLNAERAKLEAETLRHRILFEESPDGILVIDPQTAGFIEFNTTAHTQLGYSREEFARLHIFDVEAQETAERIRKHIRDVLQYGRSDFETLQRTKQGELRHVHVIAQIAQILGETVYYCTWRDITERKQAEAQLRRNEQILRLFVEHSPASIAMFDRDMRYIVTSRRYLSDFRLGDQDLTGRSHYAVFPEMDEARKEIHRHCLAGAVVRNEEDLLPRMDGTIDWVRYELRPWYEADGSIGGLIFFSEVITERKLAEQELRESEEKYRSLLASLESVVSSVDADGRFLYVNEMAARQMGAPAETLIGKTMQELFPAPVAARQLEHIRQVIREDRAMISEAPSLVQGQPRWYRTAIQPVHDHTGHVAYALINSTDIHNLKMAEAALLQQLDVERVAAEASIEERDLQLRSLFSVLPDLIIRFRRNGSILDYNLPPNLHQAALPEFLVTPRFEVSGHPEITQDFALWLDQAFATPNLLHTHHLRLAVGESQQVFEARLVAVNAEEAICVLRDITESEQAGETLRQANAELARAARFKDEFMANMSHELRTPLNAILGMSETLLEEVYGALNPQQQNSVHNIEASGRHLLALINDILDLSKVEAGQLDLQVEAVSVAEICQASLLFVKEQALKKSLRLSFTLHDQMAEMEADVRRLKQMLVNLLSNAVKFTPPKGHVCLDVDIDPDAGVIRFAVQDTGIGIAAEDLPRLFQPFKQLDSSLSRQHEGTGLGLALVRRLAELHGGSIKVESILDQGSCFTISLPYHTPQLGNDDVYLPALDRGSQPTPPRSALVVEDSESAAEQLVRYLQETNVRVFVHRQGVGALEQAITLQPNMIFLDLLMPDRSGWAVLAQLKSDPRTRAIPVIITSVMDDRTRGLAAGASEYIVKPFTRETLRRALHTLTTAGKHDAQIVPQQAPRPPTGARILLVEDNEVNILTISDYLQGHGYALSMARSGREALNQLDESRPELILMDIQMPEMDGLEATRRVRAIPAYAQVPIIALTALAMPGDRERCLAAGANEYMTKPVGLKALAEKIQQLLNT